MNTNALSKVYPSRDTSWTSEDAIMDISLMYTQIQEITDTLNELRNSIVRAHNVYELIPYAGVKDVALRDALGSDALMNISEEGVIGGVIIKTFQNALLSIKNFFLNLWANVVAFFKRLFDSNTRARAALLKSMMTFDKQRSVAGDARVQTVPLFLPPHDETVNLIANLEILYSDALEMSKSLTIAEASTFKKGMSLLGYIVKDGVIYDDHPYKIPTSQISIASSDWSVDELKVVTNRVCKLCTNAANLNAVKNSLENDVKSATRTIDKYLALGNNEGADRIQQELNNKSVRASYVFKCAVVFQSYVTQLNGMLTDAWANVLAANGQ